MSGKNRPIPVQPADAVRLLPVTETSHPFGGWKWQVKPKDPAQFGYVEEEYLIEGRAKVYTWKENEPFASPEIENAPYGNRILVRKPADPAKFSGNVIVEMCNWARGYDRPIALWGNCWKYIVERGDAWVGCTFRADVLANLKTFDPVRYEGLSLENPIPREHRLDRPQSNTYHSTSTDPDSENGLLWDYFSQVGIALRDQAPGMPMAGYPVKTIIATGATAGDLATYCAAIDPISCRPDGAPIYDGFLIFMTGAPGNVNNYEQKLHWMDPRCKFYGKVPLMRVYTCGDMTGEGWHPDWALMQRRTDSDEKGCYYRSYEVAGTGLMLKYTYYSEPRHEDVEKMGLSIKNGRTGKAWTKEDLERFEFPTRYVLDAAYDNLVKWARDGINPPSTKPFEIKGVYPDAVLAKDEHQNVLGGLRLPYLEVPAYHLYTDATSEPLEEEILHSLYKDHADYVAKVKASCERCVAERILVQRDADKILEDARQCTLI